MPKKSESPAQTFEEDLRRLEEIVEKLERGLAIEEALSLYEEGTKISNKLELRLTEVERKVYEVKNVAKLAKKEDTEMKMSLFGE
jgi:exodeoxyribonuclease VII small subunit